MSCSLSGSFFHQQEMTVRYQDVVCAFIVEDKQSKASEEVTNSSSFRVLCSQRYDDAEHFPSMYEFPGGKVDEGETHIQTMKRECSEELGIEVEPIVSNSTEGDVIAIKPCYSFHHEPKQDKRLGGLVTFRLFFYWAKIVNNSQPKALASQKVEWLTPEQMGKLTFCPGDEGIIEDMLSGTLRPPE
ncbi:uncharacterized protein FA14DRAFT_176365 [Meira miltonrushii]|uniref:8-oxo-dGTP diphosphatase n=1 Tax=Meira miltonrushii TaxID=1280837 RepID=A0A316VLT3_9BASI|nr:uncharacterized protein FA14DRAFT_176365 [Meira miltonrushii]PWN37061.1 hypothetical protein FA14DRAFT_176365 [Meira miltonrushii]